MTENISRAVGLKLVKGGPSELDWEKSYSTKLPIEQLQLPFENKSDKVIFIHEAELLMEPASTEFLEKFKPQYIFDVRIAPRLDFIANSRALAFQRFRQLNVNYIDVLARVGTWSSMVLLESEYWKECISTLARSHERAGSYIFIFDDPNTLRAARRTLPEALQASSSIP